MVRHPETGKYRRTRLFALTLAWSRKAVWILTWKSSSRIWCELHAEAFRRLGGAVGVVVLDNLREGVVEPDIYDPTLTATDPDAVRRKVLGFHAVVAKRLATRRFATEARRQLEFLPSGQEATTAATTDGAETTEPSMTKLLDLLTFEEAEVLRASLPWYEPQTGVFALPRGEAAKIASTLGTTPEAFRQRRHRSLKKLAILLQDAQPRSAVSNRAPV